MSEISLDNYKVDVDLTTIVFVRKFIKELLYKKELNPLVIQAVKPGVDMVVNLLGDYLRQKGITNEE